jgi:hypothetical protein
MPQEEDLSISDATKNQKTKKDFLHIPMCGTMKNGFVPFKAV